MFKHRGNSRTYQQNLILASLLSFVAGIVNVAGFLSVQRLTTNVTGHFAFFIDEVYKMEFWNGLSYFLYIFFFLLGSFVSNFLVEVTSRKNEGYIYIIPAIIESMLLFLTALSGAYWIGESPNTIAYLLLFSMGLQNSLVTTISNATVRTTHLTGLFTDLGIELSQLFFYKGQEQRTKLFSSIKLRLTIISFFFLGGIVSGYFYSSIGLYVLIIAASTLLLGVAFDYIKLQLSLLKRKIIRQ